MPAPRPRFVARGKFVQTYMPKEYDVWKDRVVEYVRGVNDRPEEPLAGPLVVTLVVRATPPKTTKLTHPAPDVDNYAKGVLDALTQSERWWADDKQVVSLLVTKAWCEPDEAPGIEVAIAPEKEGLVRRLLSSVRALLKI